MPKYRLKFTRDALIRGHVIIEAESKTAALLIGVSAATKHGVKLEEDVEWDQAGAVMLDNADFEGVEEVTL